MQASSVLFVDVRARSVVVILELVLSPFVGRFSDTFDLSILEYCEMSDEVDKLKFALEQFHARPSHGRF